MTASRTVADWGGTSHVVDVNGPVHYVDFGGPADGPLVVLVHGLGGSHLNWCLLAQRLVDTARVLAVDLAGFGLTNPDGRSTTVQANMALLNGFLSTVASGPVVLIGNSMGGMISILQASAHPETVTGLALIDPALPPALGVLPDPLVTLTFASYALPRLGEWFLTRSRRRTTPSQQVRQVYKLCCYDPNSLPPDLLEAAIALAERRAGVPGLDVAFLAAARSVLKLDAARARYFERMRAVRVPVMMLHGESDRLVSVQSARLAAARNPHWELTTFPRVGHVPQLEVPDLAAARILDWLARIPAEPRVA